MFLLIGQRSLDVSCSGEVLKYIVLSSWLEKGNIQGNTKTVNLVHMAKVQDNLTNLPLALGKVSFSLSTLVMNT